ncbi:transmembrane protein 53-like [Lytechinus pictus]|uniref:transmembrane protein 53-like n=1 Tax=Lytechinus pictus TaxID=7653 RepID=UPI0030BA1E6A
MADELEYHVTFPTKFSSVATRTRAQRRSTGAEAAAATGDVELTERSSPDKEPVIFLLGWYGAEDKDLAKYSAIYQSEGYVTIRYVLPGEFLFEGKLGEVNFIAVKVLEAFFDLGLEENPIFFHLFSNGGGYIYRAVTELLNGRDPGVFAALKICGVIWDSAPCRPTFFSGIRAYCLFSPDIDRHSQPWYVSYAKMAPAWLWLLVKHIVLPSFWEANNLMNSYIPAIISDKMPCPQLFIYSKADCIAWYKDIQDIVVQRRKQGCDITEAYWEDGDHLEHLAKHRDEYVDACLDLVSRGLECFESDD